MKFYLAPMEGITGYVYRCACNQFFPYIDHYYTPFITPNQTRKLTSREMNDVLPARWFPNTGEQVFCQSGIIYKGGRF